MTISRTPLKASSGAQDNTSSLNGVIESLNEPMLGHLLDRIILAAFVIDQNHIIQHWNSAMEKLSGISREEMIGTRDHWRPFYNKPRPCMADLMLDGRVEDVARLYEGKFNVSDLITEAFEAEDFFPDCGPEGEWLHFSAARINNAAGEVIGAIETLTNISDRKKAEFELLARERKYRELSITDSLTGLYNSRHFYQRLDEALANAQRYQHSFCLCFFDLDNFKQLNDRWGHLVGDRVLETFGSMVRASLRLTDSGYRYGGEEFVVLLPSTVLSEAAVVAERIRQSLEDHNFTVEHGQKINITVSLGLTEYRTGDSAETIMERVDQALYCAKREGKNRLRTS
ncbi:diguanylate cyclase [Pontibacter sp. JAM-7]|uniref:sensor domain-containing diguanylate cyclase n=1 Tax=Pontibacter sp. JAM-7 TaxID=3366581 RepID=UPI003AF947B0